MVSPECLNYVIISKFLTSNLKTFNSFAEELNSAVIYWCRCRLTEKISFSIIGFLCMPPLPRCVWVCIHVKYSDSQRSIMSFFLDHSIFCFGDRISNQTSMLAGQWSPGSACHYLPRVRQRLTHQGWGYKFWSCACVSGTLLTKKLYSQAPIKKIIRQKLKKYYL